MIEGMIEGMTEGTIPAWAVEYKKTKGKPGPMEAGIFLHGSRERWTCSEAHTAPMAQHVSREYPLSVTSR